MNTITLNGTTYERSFLEEQIEAIEASKRVFLTLRDAEIQECRDILAKMGEADEPIEPNQQEEPIETDEQVDEPIIEPLTLKL
jgi:hypothetical protein